MLRLFLGTKKDLRALHSELLKSQKATRIVEKTPNHIQYTSEIRKNFPDSPIIRIVRDPRDSAFSMGKLSWVPQDPVAGGIVWERWFRRSWKFFEQDSNTITVKYEDLVSNCQETLEQLCAFIGEQFSESMLNYHEFDDTVSTPAEVWKKDVSRKLDLSSTYRWKSLKASEEIDLHCINEICYEAIRYFNYEVVPDAKMQCCKYLDDVPLVIASRAYRQTCNSKKKKKLLFFWGIKHRRSMRLANMSALKYLLRSVLRLNLGAIRLIWVR